MSDETAFLRAICETPDDDTVRLVYADWLDENGQGDRAEFIRLQIAGNLDADAKFRVWEIINGESASWIPPFCWDRSDRSSEWIVESDRVEFNYRRGMPHAVVRRGFAEEISCTLAEFMGGKCSACRGGYVRVGHWAEPCGACRGTGTLPGLDRTLFGQHPITRVTLTDREPANPSGFQWYWGCELDFDGPSQLPEKIWNCLVGQRRGNSSYIVAEAVYATREAALAALSDACVRYARSLHGLPPLRVPRGTRELPAVGV